MKAIYSSSLHLLQTIIASQVPVNEYRSSRPSQWTTATSMKTGHKRCPRAASDQPTHWLTVNPGDDSEGCPIVRSRLTWQVRDSETARRRSRSIVSRRTASGSSLHVNCGMKTEKLVERGAGYLYSFRDLIEISKPCVRTPPVKRSARRRTY